MIDHQLIKNGEQHIIDSFNMLTPTTSDRLYIINNVFTEDALKKLRQYISTVADTKWESVEGQELRPRQKISWDPDTIIEELYEICASAADIITRVYQTPPQNFWGISLWKDTAGYSVDWHTDNPNIDIAMQVYLYGNGTMGTIFLIDGQEFVIPGNHNSGYISNHSSQEKLLHRSQCTVPPDQIRYSLYAIWSRFPKS